MYLSAYARFTLKEKPKDYLGLAQEDIVIGKNVAVKLWQLCYGLVTGALETAVRMGLISTNEELQAVTRPLMDMIHTLKLKEE